MKGMEDLIDALQLLAIEAKKISKDGISLADIPEALELLKHVDVIVKAIKEVGEIPAELKSIDDAEIVALVEKIIAFVKAFKEA